MIFSATTLSITTSSITKLSIVTLSITILKKLTLGHNFKALSSFGHYAVFHFAKCHSFIVMLSVVVLSFSA